MAASLTTNGSERRRRPAPQSDKGIAGLAGDVLNDVAFLFQTELRLLRAEIFEKFIVIGVSAALLGTGAILLVVAVVLLLEAGIAGLVACGFSWPIATLFVAGAILLVGAGLIWVGINGLSIERLKPSKTLDQLRKDTSMW
jgi:putative superfamily III holin-X